MSILIQPPNPSVGQIITFNLTYPGSDEPDDVHVEVDVGGAWQPVTGYDHIPEGKNPHTGFDLPIPPTPNWATPGQHRFRVRWTKGGRDIGSEIAYVTTTAPPSPPPPPKTWDWWVFLGKILAGAGGSALSGVLLNWWTLVALIPCAITGAIGGTVSSALGQLFVWIFDAPRIRWNGRSAFLFVLFFSIAFSMFFGLLTIGLEREAAARGETFNRVTFGVSFVSGFLSSILPGVLNNLKDEEF
jgi:hypothetical protein